MDSHSPAPRRSHEGIGGSGLPKTEITHVIDRQILFEQGGEFDEPTFLRVLGEAVRTIEGRRLPYVAMGGVASAIYGRPRWTHDIDLFMRPDDAEAALEHLDAAGFVTQKTSPDWLYKAVKEGVLADIIFRSRGPVYLDDEMLARSAYHDFNGIKVRVIAPEDLVVIKAWAHEEATPRHWHDALGIISACELDWDYLQRRARLGVRRVLSLLLYAKSKNLMVPERVLSTLLGRIYE
jgi:predicted nucleotidyltransferase